MSRRITHLRKPLDRRIGRLVVRLRNDGLELRGFYKQSSHFVSWAQIASLLDDERPLTTAAEKVRGTLVLLDMTRPAKHRRTTTKGIDHDAPTDP